MSMLSRTFLLACVLLSLTPFASAQHYHVLTRPKLPSRDSLDKLNLQIAWATQMDLDGERDAIASFQIIPGPPRTQLVVQTWRGVVHLFDAETGDHRWKTQMPYPYWSGYDAGYNSHSIYVTRRDTLYCLSRDRGTHRFLEQDRTTKARSAGFRLEFAPSTGPAADENSVFLVLNNRVIAYAVPNFEVIIKAKQVIAENELFRDETDPFLPARLWTYFEPGMQVDHTPVPTASQLGMVTTDGRFLSFNKVERLLRIEYKTFAGISANVTFHGETAYFGSRDFTLYALNSRNAQLAWRYLAGAPIVQRPYVTDHDVLVAAERKGMSRLDRISGARLWTNNEADRVLTLNNNFVYALDRLGNMLVLDGLRGTTMSRYDMRDWLVPLANELTDRIYFTNHDGQLFCMRHRDNEDALLLRAPEPPPEKKGPPLTPAPAAAPVQN